MFSNIYLDYEESTYHLYLFIKIIFLCITCIFELEGIETQLGK